MFVRSTILAAVEVFNRLTQADFNQLTLRLGLENEITADTSISVGKKCALLGREVVGRADQVVETVDGEMTLGELVIREAVKLTNKDNEDDKQTAFLRGLSRDGFAVSYGSEYRSVPVLRRALPEEIDLPVTDDEVHSFLRDLNFHISLGHLKQAINAHTRGDWAATNAQIRSFLESLFDEIAKYSYPQDAARQTTSENRRSLLAKKGFFLESQKEWTKDGKSYVNGLFKMLHTEGSHPGLSDEEHSTFRLHIVLVTARIFLRQL